MSFARARAFGAPPVPTVLRGRFVFWTRNPFAMQRNPDGTFRYPKARPDLFFMAELDSLWRIDPAEAERILGEYLAAGFNHVVTGPVVEAGYHGHFADTDWRDDPDGFAAFLQWLTDRGAAYSLFVLPDIAPWFHGPDTGWDLARVESDLGALYRHPTVQRLTERVVIAWEQWAPVANMEAAFRWLTATFPRPILRGWHNGVGHDAPCTSDTDSQVGWSRCIAAGCNWHPFQAHPPNARPEELDGRTPVEMARYDLWDAVRRLHNKPDSPWGHQPGFVTPTGGHVAIDLMEGPAFGLYWDRIDAHAAYTRAALGVPGVRYVLDGAPLTEVPQP